LVISNRVENVMWMRRVAPPSICKSMLLSKSKIAIIIHVCLIRIYQNLFISAQKAAV
jgi:hypothetical protein